MRRILIAFVLAIPLASAAQEVPALDSPAPVVVVQQPAPDDGGWTPAGVVAVITALVGLVVAIERLFKLVSATKENTKAVKQVNQNLTAQIKAQPAPNSEPSE